MFIPTILNTKKVYGKMLNFIISIFEYGWCYCHTCRQILLPWQMLMPMILWQMLLSWQMFIANFIMYYVFMADVIAKGLCVHPLFTVRQMLLLIFAVDVKTTFGRCCLPSGRWNSHMLQKMADVICQVADVKATIGWGCMVVCMFMVDGIAMGVI